MTETSEHLFLHLSDIHFGQEKGGTIYVHNDVKDRLIDDVREVTSRLLREPISGIIVSGDVAYSGIDKEFKAAGKWLDAVAQAGGCKPTDVHVVPGNHDIDRNKISPAADWMLTEIREKGEAALDTFLSSDRDCELLYDRLRDYRRFAEGYGCPLDLAGGHAGDNYSFALSDSTTVRFLGLNSALACSSKDEEGLLILGAKQRVLSSKPDEVLVVICHHPLNWLNDAADAWRYLRRSASVFISGHEHEPSVRLVSDEGHSDILVIAAGAAVPPKAEGPYNFTYNYLKFGWEPTQDCLSVTVHARCWDDHKKIFVADESRGDIQDAPFLIAAEKTEVGPVTVAKESGDGLDREAGDAPDDGKEITDMEDISADLRLKFFRDLSEEQRRRIFVESGVLPTDWSESLKHSVETLLFRQLISQGRSDEIIEKMAAIQDIDEENSR